MRCLLVDKITECEPGKRIAGIKNVTMSENFLQDHFPGFPVMPGVLQVEAVLQLASWLIFAATGFTRKLRLVSLKSIKFREFIVPGDQMRIEAAVTRQDAAGVVCNAAVHVDGKLKTELRQIRLDYVPVEELEDPAAAREHFDFISGRAPLGSYQHRPPSLI
jgi:3-hydroxyacyl-[acyl-carrier-protein] dehydratase